jgi:sulfur carrier protein ThiS adenylyltransferase
MLVNVVLERLPHRYLVAASGMAGLGTPNTIRTRKVMKRFYLCGDEVSDVEDAIGLVAPRVMLCAAHQAQIVLRILAGEFEV